MHSDERRHRQLRARRGPVALRFTTGDSPVGKLLVASTERGLCAVALGEDSAVLEAELQARFPDAELTEAGPELRPLLDAVAGSIGAAGSAFPEPLDAPGTEFQRAVWNALRQIPPGETSTYAEIAKAIGRPSAVRAVGAACGANPIALVVPCHRVIGRDGSLTGYRWGVARKRRLLEIEAGARKGKGR